MNCFVSSGSNVGMSSVRIAALREYRKLCEAIGYAIYICRFNLPIRFRFQSAIRPSRKIGHRPFPPFIVRLARRTRETLLNTRVFDDVFSMLTGAEERERRVRVTRQSKYSGSRMFVGCRLPIHHSAISAAVKQSISEIRPRICHGRNEMKRRRVSLALEA